jgi:hypothetical protein
VALSKFEAGARTEGHWQDRLRYKRRTPRFLRIVYDAALDEQRILEQPILQTTEIVPPDTIDSSLSAEFNNVDLGLDELEDLIKLRESLQIVKPKRKSNRVRNIFAGAVLALSMATGASRVAPGIISEVGKVQDAVSQNQADIRLSELPTAQFIKEYKAKFPNVKLGFTFSPEELGLTPNNINTKAGEKLNQKVMDTLDRMINTYGFKEIRVGLRWDTPLEFYKPFLDEMITGDANIILNLGIKVNRWPEQHVPQEYQSELKRISENGGVVHVTDNIAKQALINETSNYKDLKTWYKPEQLKHFTEFQVNNEAFNPYGLEPVVMDEGVQEESILNVLKEFPNAKIDMNSAGPLNVKQISNFFKGLIKKNPNFENKFTLGIDDYSISFGKTNIDYIGDVDFQNWPGLGKINNHFIDRVWNNEYEAALKDSREYKFQIRIDEAGISAWGNEARPNPVKDAKYELVSASELLDPNVKSVVMVWDENKVIENAEILRIFQAINV